jgi:ribonuclease M5
MERLKIPYPVIVEGRYDKLRLESVIEAHIIPTDGFGIFKKAEVASMLRALAERTPLILLTDSDGAGKLIRSHLTSVLPRERVIQLYVPRILGKEKRKKEVSAEGILGVEGMERTLLYELFAPYADSEAVANRMAENPLSKTDFYRDGLTGGDGSREKRDELCLCLGLPTGMTPNALLAALRVLCTYEEYCALVGREEVSI